MVSSSRPLRFVITWRTEVRSLDEKVFRSRAVILCSDVSRKAIRVSAGVRLVAVRVDGVAALAWACSPID
jgi:hypothetical protein